MVIKDNRERKRQKRKSPMTSEMRKEPEKGAIPILAASGDNHRIRLPSKNIIIAP